MKINYVEDEKDLAEIVRKYLVKEGYEVSLFYDGETAIKHADDKVDLWILDIMLTGEVDGFALINEIKKYKPETAVFFTSARDQALDKIKGLELGSDDYLAKPFSLKELLLRVKAILRRHNQNQAIIEYEPYSISIEKREVLYKGQVIDLTNKEFEMLLYFLKNKNTPIDRKLLLEAVWGKNYYGSDRVVDDLLRRLRQKLPKLRVETIYGLGYRLL